MKYENIRTQVLEAILEAVDQGLIHGMMCCGKNVNYPPLNSLTRI